MAYSDPADATSSVLVDAAMFMNGKPQRIVQPVRLPVDWWLTLVDHAWWTLTEYFNKGRNSCCQAKPLRYYVKLYLPEGEGLVWDDTIPVVQCRQNRDHVHWHNDNKWQELSDGMLRQAVAQRLARVTIWLDPRSAKGNIPVCHSCGKGGTFLFWAEIDGLRWPLVQCLKPFCNAIWARVSRRWEIQYNWQDGYIHLRRPDVATSETA